VRRKALETKATLAATEGYFYNLYMRKSRVAGLLFLATAALAQHQQSVEITSEPSHHLVFQNEYVRVFNVTVAPHATTLVHKHNYDYLFVTLGDSDVVSVRPGEKPVALKLKDGEVRFTPGNFAHAAINQSDRPFHNITIELLKPSTNVKTCDSNCTHTPPCNTEDKATCATMVHRIFSDGWQVSMVTLPSSWHIEDINATPQTLLVPISALDLTQETGANTREIKLAPGEVAWFPSGLNRVFKNNSSAPARLVALEFKQEPSKP
jgi:quercetin dioxygenase-like cupin family protein